MPYPREFESETIQYLPFIGAGSAGKVGPIDDCNNHSAEVERSPFAFQHTFKDVIFLKVFYWNKIKGKMITPIPNWSTSAPVR
jgi:hypothetical protein